MNHCYIVYSEENHIICVVKDGFGLETLNEACRKFYSTKTELVIPSSIGVLHPYDPGNNISVYEFSFIEFGATVDYRITLERTYIADTENNLLSKPGNTI